jgi:hypothetical protein
MLFLFSFMVMYGYFGYELELGLVIGFKCLLCDISYYFYNLKYLFLYSNSPFIYINISIYFKLSKYIQSYHNDI